MKKGKLTINISDESKDQLKYLHEKFNFKIDDIFRDALTIFYNVTLEMGKMKNKSTNRFGEINEITRHD